MSGILPGFGTGGASGSGNGWPGVSGRGHVKNIGDPKDPKQQVLVGRPYVARGAGWIEHPDGITGPTTWWSLDTGGRLMKAKNVPCNGLLDIELQHVVHDRDYAALCSEGKDTFFIEKIVFWGATAAVSNTFSASLWTDVDRTGVEIMPAGTDLSGLVDKYSAFVFPVVPTLAARFSRLHWKVSVPQDMTINIAAYGGVLDDTAGF